MDHRFLQEQEELGRQSFEEEQGWGVVLQFVAPADLNLLDLELNLSWLALRQEQMEVTRVCLLMESVEVY